MKTPFSTPTRRSLLRSAGAGFGHLALNGLIGAATSKGKALAPRASHFPAKAKKVIFLLMEGAISSLDTFEYKPERNVSPANPARAAAW